MSVTYGVRWWFSLGTPVSSTFSYWLVTKKPYLADKEMVNQNSKYPQSEGYDQIVPSIKLERSNFRIKSRSFNDLLLKKRIITNYSTID